MWPFSPDTRERGRLPDLATAPDESSSLVEGVLEPPKPELEQEELLRITGHANQRLGIHPILRAPILGLATFLCGFSIGAAHGGPIAAYRYRAENAHRLPTTQTGWFLYQKSKNYHSLVGAMKEGTKYGGILLGWSTLFLLAEEGIDQARSRLFAPAGQDFATGQRDAVNTVMAAMGVAGFYSWKNSLDHFATARTAKLALKVSLPFGLAQDAAASFRGSEPAYVRWIRQHTFWRDEDSEI